MKVKKLIKKLKKLDPEATVSIYHRHADRALDIVLNGHLDKVTINWDNNIILQSKEEDI